MRNSVQKSFLFQIKIQCVKLSLGHIQVHKQYIRNNKRLKIGSVRKIHLNFSKASFLHFNFLLWFLNILPMFLSLLGVLQHIFVNSDKLVEKFGIIKVHCNNCNFFLK